MSIDYEIHLDTPLSFQLLESIDFREHSKNGNVIQGTVGNNGLSAYIIASPEIGARAQREREPNLPLQLILSPNVEKYEESMSDLIEIINAIIPTTNRASLHMNNELLLLDKAGENTTLYTSNNDWWNEYIKDIKLPYSQR